MPVTACIVASCPDVAAARGYCHLHYTRYYQSSPLNRRRLSDSHATWQDELLAVLEAGKAATVRTEAELLHALTQPAVFVAPPVERAS